MRRKKDIIYELIYQGYSQSEIHKNTGIQKSLINYYCREYTFNEVNKDGNFFNVNELDCWIFPDTERFKKYVINHEQSIIKNYQK